MVLCMNLWFIEKVSVRITSKLTCLAGEVLDRISEEGVPVGGKRKREEVPCK